jgi:hypothetical protein
LDQTAAAAEEDQQAWSTLVALLLLDQLDTLGTCVAHPSRCSFVVEAEVSDDVRLTPAQDEKR